MNIKPSQSSGNLPLMAPAQLKNRLTIINQLKKNKELFGIKASKVTQHECIKEMLARLFTAKTNKDC
jgi:hypothetical protein